MLWTKRSFYKNSRRLTLLILSALYTVVLIFSYLTFVAPDRSYISIWLNDVIGFLDIANRIQRGQMPYEDFHLFYGPAVAVIPALGLVLGLKAGAIFGFDSLVVAAVILLGAIATMPQRLTLPAAILVFVFISLLIVVPMTDGGSFFGITWANFYNRQAWAALTLLFLFYVEPQAVRSRDMWLDAIVVAVLVLFSIYTKITFGVVAIGFLIANSVTSKYNRNISVIGLTLIALLVLSFELVFRFHLAYWHDITEFMSRTGATGGRVWLGGIVSMLINNAPIMLACLGAVFATRAAGRRTVLDSFFAVGGIIASLLVRYSTGVGSGLIALVAVLVGLSELARRAEMKPPVATSPQIDQKPHMASTGCLMLALIFVLPEVGNRLVAWEESFVKAKNADLGTMPGVPLPLASILVPSSDGPGLFDLYAENSPFADQLMQFRSANGRNYDLPASDYMKTIIEGANLLQAVDYHNRSVFTFDMVNPFTFALDMRPTEHGYPQFWIGGPFTDDPNRLPLPEDLLADADFVMVPRLPITPSQLTIMMRIYGPYLKQNYFRLRESSHWELWAPK